MYIVSYSGVHQAYQLALAAQESALLRRFYCSYYAELGKWGGAIAKLVGDGKTTNRKIAGLDDQLAVEHPWPDLLLRLNTLIGRHDPNGWLKVAQKFDKWVATKILAEDALGIVCSEVCAEKTFIAAEKLGWRRIYDCPGHNAEELRRDTLMAAKLTGLPFVTVADTPDVTRQKEVEISLADVVLSYSDFHTRGILRRGVPPEKIRQIPLWADCHFWEPPVNTEKISSPLRIIYAGGITLRKGVPFLVEAVRDLAPHANLTLVGTLDPDATAALKGIESFATVVKSVDKRALRTMYHNHDVLVLPSLGDSFGFVAMEAMACGIPVVVSSHCGVPVPDPSWRVPVMDSASIRDRLGFYLDQPDRLISDGIVARDFAEQFSPERYRASIGDVFREVMSLD